jgi:hypothetical protein
MVAKDAKPFMAVELPKIVDIPMSEALANLPKTPPKPLITLQAQQINAKEFMPTIAIPQASNTLWSTSSYATVRTRRLTIMLNPPAKSPKDKRWAPVLGAVKEGMFEKLPTAALKWEGRPYFKQQTFFITLSELETKGLLINEKKEISERSFKIKPGVMLSNTDGSGKEISYDMPQTVHVVTLGDLTGAVELRLTNFAFARLDKQWISRPNIPLGDKSFNIQLFDATDIPMLDGLLAGADNFQVRKLPAPPEGQGIFFVRARKVVARAYGEIQTTGQINFLTKLLNAEFAYRGKASSYIGGLPEYRKLSKDKNRLPPKIYVVNDGEFIGISRDFMQNAAVQRFLKDNTSTFFSEPIELIESRKTAH